MFMEHLYGICRITHSAHILITEPFKKYLNKMKKALSGKTGYFFFKVNAAVMHPIDQST